MDDKTTRRVCAGTYTGVHEPGCAVPLGPSTSADLLELDAVPESVDSDAPTDVHARTLARART